MGRDAPGDLNHNMAGRGALSDLNHTILLKVYINIKPFTQHSLCTHLCSPTAGRPSLSNAEI
jgi:hypothetical protein